MGNGVIEVTGKTGKEYTRSGYSQYIEKNDAQVYDDKLRAAGNLNEAVRASTDYVNEEIKHPRKDNIREFARGRVLMRIGQNDYNAEVVVGYTKNGEMLLYDIVNFKPDTFSVKERTSRQPGRGEAGMTETNEESSSDNSISQNNAAVNSQYTQESENDASDAAENGADEGDFAVDREGSEASAAFGDEALDREGYTPTEQTRVIAMNEATPSYAQTVRFRRLHSEGKLTADTIEDIMAKPKANQRETVKFSYERIARFFPPNYSTKQMEDAIVRILEERKREVPHRRDDTERG